VNCVLIRNEWRLKPRYGGMKITGLVKALAGDGIR
jgi:hypothetical protein